MPSPDREAEQAARRLSAQTSRTPVGLASSPNSRRSRFDWKPCPAL
jgi:hypothetical protein